MKRILAALTLVACASMLGGSARAQEVMMDVQDSSASLYGEWHVELVETGETQNGNVTQYSYDVLAQENLDNPAETTQNGYDRADRVTVYAYDQYGEQGSALEAPQTNNNSTAYTYDDVTHNNYDYYDRASPSDPDQWTTTDGQGGVTQYTYDFQAGATADPDQFLNSGPGLDTTQNQYDFLEGMITTTDPILSTTVYVYDSNGNTWQGSGNLVPEPAALALLLPGLLPVGLVLRRRRWRSVARPNG